MYNMYDNCSLLNYLHRSLPIQTQSNSWLDTGCAWQPPIRFFVCIWHALIWIWGPNMTDTPAMFPKRERTSELIISGNIIFRWCATERNVPIPWQGLLWRKNLEMEKLMNLEDHSPDCTIWKHNNFGWLEALRYSNPKMFASNVSGRNNLIRPRPQTFVGTSTDGLCRRLLFSETQWLEDGEIRSFPGMTSEDEHLAQILPTEKS